tara:strand:- start:5205 stop:5651 length:447 start_codon:yes stop_codon:yes gene_type:complete
MDWNRGDFTFIHESVERDVLNNAFCGISRLKLWDWLKDSTFESFSMCKGDPHPSYSWFQIYNAIDPGHVHSGASFGWTMRNMEYIAKNGWNKFKIIQYRSIYTNHDELANKIKTQFKKSISDPEYFLCKKRLNNEFEKFSTEIKNAHK